jgi:hypothetical protein
MENKDKRDMLPEGEYLKQMSSLPKVRAPDDFLQKVRERIEKRPLYERIVRALFVPFRIKIPLEVAAVTATLLLVISTLEVTKPMKQLANVPRSDVETAVVGRSTVLKAEISKDSMVCEKKSDIAPAPAAADAAVSAPASVASGECFKMKEMEYKGLCQADILSAIKGHIASVQGTITHIETDKDTGSPQYIDAEIPAANYELFKKKLENPAISRNIKMQPILKEAPQGRNIIQIRIFVI